MSSNNDSATHLTGRVKWFNNKAGYGFITVTDGPRSGSDIFVHHSAINVENQQYKYLVQGEYVEFDLVQTESKTHEWQAAAIIGIKGGKLMCETRRELKFARTEYKTTKQPEESQSDPKMPRQKAPVTKEVSSQKKSSAPREPSSDKKEWTLVAKSEPKKARGRPPRQNTTQK